MANSRRETRAALNHGSEALQKLPAEAMDAVGMLLREVRDETLDMVEAGRDRMTLLSKSAENAVQHRPMRSLAIALGVGCMIGLLLRKG